MGRYIMKVVPDRDLYVEWSTVIDYWTYIGNREEMLEYLRDNFAGPSQYFLTDYPELVLTCCDETGTSVQYRNSVSGVACGSWDDRTINIENMGTLKRADLGKFIDLLYDADACSALITPFDWSVD